MRARAITDKVMQELCDPQGVMSTTEADLEDLVVDAIGVVWWEPAVWGFRDGELVFDTGQQVLENLDV